jgi:hypothetical protein
MAIAASQQTLVHAVTEGLGKIRLLVRVAAIAQVRLLGHEQRSPFLGEMRGMARDTANAVGGVRRVDEIGMLAVALVAFQTPRADNIRGCVLEAENLRLVTAAFDVGRSWTMASFATVGFSPGSCFEDAVPMPRPLQVFEYIFVAGLAGFGSGI